MAAAWTWMVGEEGDVVRAGAAVAWIWWSWGRWAGLQRPEGTKEVLQWWPECLGCGLCSWLLRQRKLRGEKSAVLLRSALFGASQTPSGATQGLPGL